MTDRELLTLAAKAAGMDGYLPCECCDSFINSEAGESPIYWNPLLDDGDAFRLAVRLQIRTDTGYAWRDGFGGFGESQQSIAKDPLAATRRAIVRAAAEIGKG